MNLKATLLLLVLGWSGPVMCQFKNSLVGQPAEGQRFFGGPTNAVNPRDPANIVVTAAPGYVYYTQDGGKTWHAQSAAPAGSSPVVIADSKGNFYCIDHSRSAKAEDDSRPYGSGRMVIRRSEDGGLTWSEGESVALDQPEGQDNGWATTDHRGNLYATWRQVEGDDDTAGLPAFDILFSMSKNGKKWSDPVVISKLTGNSVNGQLSPAGALPVVTPEGKVMIAWSHADKIYLDRSFNGGEVWLRNDIEVTAQPGGDHLAIPGHGPCNGTPVLLTDKSKSQFRGSLYLVWADQRNGTDDTDIWFSRSHNFGDNWSSPMRINDDGKGKHQYMPWMAVDETTGYLYIVYFDRRNYDGNKTDVYLAYSTSGGASFENVRISERPFTPEEGNGVAYSSYISASNGIVAPIWTGVDNGNPGIWTAIISDDELVKSPKK